MATQSKSVEQLKSEVLQTSSRPYELTEYNSDKIITGEINPGLINSNIATYEKNSEGTIIIDKNKDLSNQKMLISLNTTKISNTKFNQLIPPTGSGTPVPLTIPQFFEAYDNLFYEIPIEGDINSHTYLVQRSSEYIGVTLQNDEINALLEEINALRQEVLDANKTILDLSNNIG